MIHHGVSKSLFFTPVFNCRFHFSICGEAWRFLPCFHNDVRGIEAHNVADGHFHDSLPDAARRLLEGGSLKNDEMREFHWHTVEFPHWDFMESIPGPLKNNLLKRLVFGNLFCIIAIVEIQDT